MKVSPWMSLEGIASGERAERLAIEARNEPEPRGVMDSALTGFGGLLRVFCGMALVAVLILSFQSMVDLAKNNWELILDVAGSAFCALVIRHLVIGVQREFTAWDLGGPAGDADRRTVNPSRKVAG